MEVTIGSEALWCQRVAKGDSASMRAGTRVNVEQASKRAMRGPTHLRYGEAPPIGAAKPELQRPWNDRRFPSLESLVKRLAVTPGLSPGEECGLHNSGGVTGGGPSEKRAWRATDGLDFLPTPDPMGRI